MLEQIVRVGFELGTSGGRVDWKPGKVYSRAVQFAASAKRMLPSRGRR
jgi:hypothetical protein